MHLAPRPSHLKSGNFLEDSQAQGESTKQENAGAHEFYSSAGFTEHLSLLTRILPCLFAPR